jgi:hypothetical protein
MPPCSKNKQKDAGDDLELPLAPMNYMVANTSESTTVDTETSSDQPVGADPLIKQSKSNTTKVHVKFIAPRTTGLVIAGIMHSLSGGVCHSLGDQSLGTSVEEINLFFQLDVDTMAVKIMKEEVVRLKDEFSGSYKNDQLKVLVQDAYK